MSFQFGKVADEIQALQDKVDKLNADYKAKVEPLEKEIKAKTETLQLAMQDAGLTYVEGKKAKCDLKENVLIGFSDFEAFVQFARRRGAFHLFQRRIAVNAYRELKEQLGKAIPGLVEIPKASLNVSKRK